MIRRIDDGFDARDHLLQDLLDALLERDRGHAAALTPAAHRHVDDVVFHANQLGAATMCRNPRIDVVHEHGLDLQSQWIGRIECVRHIKPRWLRRVDDEARLEWVVAKVDRCALNRRQTLRIDQDPQPVGIDGDVALAQRVSRLQRHVVLGRTAAWIFDENAQRGGLWLTGQNRRQLLMRLRRDVQRNPRRWFRLRLALASKPTQHVRTAITLTAVAIVEVDNLVKRYKGARTNAVDGISFAIEPGEFFTLLGPYGAGKTTTISILTTTLAPTSGVVRVGNHDIWREASDVRQDVGIIFQRPSLDLNLTAEENVRLHTFLYGLYPFRPTFRLMPSRYRDQVGELASLLDIDRSRPSRAACAASWRSCGV